MTFHQPALVNDKTTESENIQPATSEGSEFRLQAPCRFWILESGAGKSGTIDTAWGLMNCRLLLQTDVGNPSVQHSPKAGAYFSVP
jgi:hypothetical protein